MESFSQIIGNRWLSLASLLCLTTAEIEEIKQETEMCREALYVLEKWNSREEGTYGKLLDHLNTVPLFSYY